MSSDSCSSDRPDTGESDSDSRPTVIDALIRAYRVACGEFQEFLPQGVPVSQFDPSFANDHAFAAATIGARKHLQPLLPELFLEHVIHAVVYVALVDVCHELADCEPDRPGAKPRWISDPYVTNAGKPYDGWQTWGEEVREPWRPQQRAVAIAFMRACDEYTWDFPLGLPFDQLGPAVRDLFFERGRVVAFEVLQPCLPPEVAIKVAEAISEAAWQVRARELASTK